jgi:hypothetical protein
MGLYDARGGDNIIVDPILTNISVEWANLTVTAADVLFPPVRVTKQAGKYLVFGRKAFTTNFGGDVRAPGSAEPLQPPRSRLRPPRRARRARTVGIRRPP